MIDQILDYKGGAARLPTVSMPVVSAYQLLH